MRLLSRLTLLALILNSYTCFARPMKERVESASDIIVNRQTSLVPISNWVIDKTKCIAALRIVKAGFIWGGQGSTGLVSCRTADNQWSAGSFLQVSGVTFGFQIGVQFLESVVLFITDMARNILDRPSFQMGGDVSVAAGPVGAGGGAGVMPTGDLLHYQRSVGLYAGATINGLVISHLNRYNREAFEKDIEPKEILQISGEKSPDALRPFFETLEKYFPIY